MGGGTTYGYHLRVGRGRELADDPVCPAFPFGDILVKQPTKSGPWRVKAQTAREGLQSQLEQELNGNIG